MHLQAYITPTYIFQSFKIIKNVFLRQHKVPSFFPINKILISHLFIFLIWETEGEEEREREEEKVVKQT